MQEMHIHNYIGCNLLFATINIELYNDKDVFRQGTTYVCLSVYYYIEILYSEYIIHVYAV